MGLSTNLTAQSVAQNVLDEIVISKTGYTGIIKVIFTVPLRYISHSPSQQGKEIRIKVDIIRNNTPGKFKGDSRSLRESLVPQYSDSFGLEEVIFENVLRDDYIILIFNKDVSFEIIQSSNYRSFSILIHDVK